MKVHTINTYIREKHAEGDSSHDEDNEKLSKCTSSKDDTTILYLQMGVAPLCLVAS
jgi:hypothetical protein